MGNDTWRKDGEERVLQATGTKTLREYIERRQGAVAGWVSLRPIFQICANETGYEAGGRARRQWWRQTAAERQLQTTLKDILAVAWERRQRESIRRGEGKRGAEESDSGGDR